MKIHCPKCQHEGTIPDDKVPAAGITANCPKCKTKFQVTHEKSKLRWCPFCGTKTLTSEIKCTNCQSMIDDNSIKSISNNLNFNQDNAVAFKNWYATHRHPGTTVTQQKTDTSFGGNIGTGCASAIICLVFGALLCFIPLIGWILGPIVIFMGVLSPIGGFLHGVKDSFSEPTTFYLIQGACPYCSGRNTTRIEDLYSIVGIDCQICKKRIVVREGGFWKVES